MSNRSDPAVPDAVVQAFDSDCIVLAIESILPVKAMEKTVKSSHKYRQIAASIREIGLVEPPVVIQGKKDPTFYLLLDDHLRIEVLLDLIGAERNELLFTVETDGVTPQLRAVLSSSK